MDLIIFWGLIIAAYGLAISLQMETTNVSLAAIIVALLTSLVVLVQVIRYRGVVNRENLILRRVLPSNTLTIPTNNLTVTAISSHRLTLVGTPYGNLQIGTWRRASKVAELIKQQGETK